MTGRGNDAFSAGGQPDEMTLASIEEELYMSYRAIPGAAVRLTKPLIGAAAGTVLGGGFTLATMTDMLIAVFSYPEAHASVANGLIGSFAVRIPHKVAMQIMREAVILARSVPFRRSPACLASRCDSRFIVVASLVGLAVLLVQCCLLDEP